MRQFFPKHWLAVLVIAGSLPGPAPANAQGTGQITGTVTGEAGQPLAGASVVVAGTTRGAQAAADGRFTITGVAPGAHSVRASFAGHAEGSAPVTVSAGQTATVNLRLTTQAVQLQGVVAVGYGTQRKVNLTGSVAAVDMEEAAALPVPTLTHALQGLSPGLQVLDGGHLPGRYATSILVRGQGTLGRGGDRVSASASRPLVLIDGIEGDMNTVDINDVASISVLKDASSAAIYGSRAANGVILITTKRGTASARPQISYSGYTGIQNPTAWPETVGALRHMELRNVARTNMRNWCASTSRCNPADYQNTYTDAQVESARRGEFTNTNWFEAQFGPAPIQDHSLRIAGGSEAARYALALDYMREEGMMANTGANRYGARLNTDFVASPRVSGGMDVALSRRWDIIPGNTFGSLFFLIHDTPPTRAVRTEDGKWGLNLFGFNPVAYANDTGDEQRALYQGTAAGRLNFDLIPGWARLQTLASVRYDNEDWERFFTDSRYIDAWPTNGARWGPNRLEQRDIRNIETTLRAVLDYGHTFLDEAHEVSGVLGYEQIASNREDFRAWRQDFYNNELRQINVGNADTRGNFGTGSEWALRSVFGRLNYAILGRYLLEANARYDGSSRFAEGRRFGLFPSFSAGWRVSEEPFFRLGFVDDLKLRASWGRLGNQEVPLYSYYSSISITQPYWFGGRVNDGSAVLTQPNPDLSWETTTATDLGFDAGFLDGRLSVTGDVYHRRTEDILLQVPIPAMVGRGAPHINAGVVENRGWEVEAGWRDQLADLDYSVTVNLSDNRNKVLDLNGTGPYVQGETVVRVGSPIRAWYGFEVDSKQPYFRDQAEIDAHAQPSGWITRPGDLRFVDQDGDGKINENDRVQIGDPSPRYIFGTNLAARWRNFDTGIFLQGVGKRDQYIQLGFAQGPVWENYTSRWHQDYYDPAKDNQDARHPTYYANYNRNYYTTSSHWILQGRFVKLRNVTLGYTLPSNLVQDGLGMERMRINVTGKNLWASHRMGIDLDPEYPWVRGDYYPQTRVFSIGTDITF